MSRSGYSDEYGEDFNNQLEFYRSAVDSAFAGKRGQAFMKDLLAALDAMPEKRLVPYAFETEEGEVCALGAVARVKNVELPKGEMEDVNPYALGRKLNIAQCMVREIMFENDEAGDYYVTPGETPEHRWERMRGWVMSHIKDNPA